MCKSLNSAVNKCINLFCTFIFAVLLLKFSYWWSVTKILRFRLFLTVAKPLTTVTYYLMAWLNKPDDMRQAWRHCSQKNPFRRKNLADIFYTSRVIINFVPNFVAMATGVSRGKCNWQHSMAHLRKPSYGRKNLVKIFYANRVKANFVPNFVAMATVVGRRKRQLAAFDSASPKTLL